MMALEVSKARSALMLGRHLSKAISSGKRPVSSKSTHWIVAARHRGVLADSSSYPGEAFRLYCAHVMTEAITYR